MSKEIDDEEAEPETLEEAGILEADVGARLLVYQINDFFYKIEVANEQFTGDQQLAGIDPKLKINMDPLAHQDLRPEMMFIREELRQAKLQTLAVRRAALKQLLMKDFMQEDCELKNIGLSYSPPDP